MLIVNSNLTNLLEEKNATLIYDQAKFPVVKSSFSRMTQLFQNLISNGVKFKGEEDPVVMVTCKKEAGKIIFSIKDNGIGIDEKHHKKIFELFQKLEIKKGLDSTGIGLSLVKKIVKRNKGEIYLKSQVDKGATFYFTLPI